MARVQEVTIYKFNELSDDAKEKAREWWRKLENEEGLDTEFMYDDFARVADMMGIDLRTRPVKLMGGGTRMEPCIYYSGFWSQGDGACFEGSYSYKKGSVKAIKTEYPTDKDLHKIVTGLYEAQRRHFYRLYAKVEHTSRYYHSHSVTIEVSDNEYPYNDIGDDEEVIADLLRDFMNWMYRWLEKEYEWRMADEQVDESIIANEYEFDEDGGRA